MPLENDKDFTPITERAINSLKCTRVIAGEGSEKYNEHIRNIARRVLIESLHRQDGHPHDEVAILTRLNMTYTSQPIMGCWDDNAGTSLIFPHRSIEYNFMLDENLERTLVFVHNHPCNERLSLNDILLFLSTPQIIAMVAIGNNGIMRYIVKESQDDIHYTDLANNVHLQFISKRKTEKEIYEDLCNNQIKYKIKLY